MKIEQTLWFNEMSSTRPIGIVIGSDEVTGEKKAFIGTGDGISASGDAKHITEWGTKLKKHMIKEIYNQMIIP
jgi:hypothetical protein